MKKIITISSLAIGALVANGQSFIAGLNFDNIADVSGDIAFDTGPEAGLFTLNLQSGGSDDNFGYNLGVAGFNNMTDPGWAALGDTITDAGGSFLVGQGGTLPTVESASGFAASTSVFGGTSANAQGFSATNGIAFTQTSSGIFTIGITQAIDNASISFDVAALAGFGQSAGTLSVNGTNVGVTLSPANQVVSLGSLGVGNTITFDMSSLSSGATFDNFMVSGTVVPEPSAFAIISGVFAMAFVAYRRRR